MWPAILFPKTLWPGVLWPPLSGSGPPLVPMDASFRAAFSDGITISPEEPIMPNPFGEGITVRGNP